MGHFFISGVGVHRWCCVRVHHGGGGEGTGGAGGMCVSWVSVVPQLCWLTKLGDQC